MEYTVNGRFLIWVGLFRIICVLKKYVSHYLCCYALVYVIIMKNTIQITQRHKTIMGGSIIRLLGYRPTRLVLQSLGCIPAHAHYIETFSVPRRAPLSGDSRLGVILEFQYHGQLHNAQFYNHSTGMYGYHLIHFSILWHKTTDLGVRSNPIESHRLKSFSDLFYGTRFCG